MKYIFDFDDVLFHTSKQRGYPLFKEFQFSILEKAGIPMTAILEYYERERLNQFSLKKMLKHFSLSEDVYNEILNHSKNFVNIEMIELVKNLEQWNCIILTYGDIEFQLDKIEKSGIAPLFSQIIAVEGSKKETLEKICKEFSNESVIFIDDSIKHFDSLDPQLCSNLKTIHYTGQKLDKSSFL